MPLFKLKTHTKQKKNEKQNNAPEFFWNFFKMCLSIWNMYVYKNIFIFYMNMWIWVVVFYALGKKLSVCTREKIFYNNWYLHLIFEGISAKCCPRLPIGYQNKCLLEFWKQNTYKQILITLVIHTDVLRLQAF